MIKYVTRKATVADAVSEALGELQSLGEELREAFDNTPESLQQSSMGQAREEAADALENLTEPDVPGSLAQLEVSYGVPQRTPKQQMRLSRAARRDDAILVLDACTQALDDIANDEKESEDRRDEAEALRDELDNLRIEAEGVEFPGMRG